MSQADHKNPAPEPARPPSGKVLAAIFVPIIALAVAGGVYFTQPTEEEVLIELEQGAAQAALEVIMWERRVREAGESVAPQATRDSLRAAERRQTLADRELRRFLD